jgi:hypothetical protein
MTKCEVGLISSAKGDKRGTIDDLISSANSDERGTIDEGQFTKYE